MSPPLNVKRDAANTPICHLSPCALGVEYRPCPADWSKLGSFHNRCQRCILNILWTDFLYATHMSVLLLVNPSLNRLCVNLVYTYFVMSPGFQIQFLPTLLFDWPVTFEKGQILIGEEYSGALQQHGFNTLHRILIFHPNWLALE